MPKVLKKDPALEKNGPDGYGLVPTLVDPAESEIIADAARKLKEERGSTWIFSSF